MLYKTLSRLVLVAALVLPGLASCAVSRQSEASFDPRLYGLKVDDGVSDSAAINLAATAIDTAGGGDLKLPAGTIKCDTKLVIPATVNLRGAGIGATNLDFTAAGAITNCIESAGSMALLSPQFNASILAGAKTITFASAPTGLAAGDLILLENDAASTFSTARSEYHAGEIVRVLSVSSGTVTLETPTFGAYSTGGTSVAYKVTPTQTEMSDFKATFKSGLTGIRIKHGYRSRVTNVQLAGSDVSQLTFDKSFESSASNVLIDDRTASVGQNYGITIANSQRIDVAHSMLTTTRHGLAIGGDSENGAIVNREITVSDSLIGSHTAGTLGADMHGNVEFIKYVSCRMPNGAYIAGDHTEIVDCDIRATSGASSYAIYASELLGPNHLIQGNRFTAVAAMTGGSSALVNVGKNNDAFAYATRAGTFTIAENRLDMGAYDGDGIYAKMADSTTAMDVNIRDNEIIATTAAAARYGIMVDSTSSTIGWRFVDITGNLLRYATLRVEDSVANKVVVRENRIDHASVDGIVVSGGATYHTTHQDDEELIDVSDNWVFKPTKTGILIVGAGDGSKTYVTVKNNTSLSAIQGSATGSTYTDSSCYIADALVAVMERNTFGKLPNDGTSSQSRLYGLSNITSMYERENHTVGSVTAVEEGSITARLGGTTHQGKHVVRYVASAPSSGGAKGDHAINIDPDAGEPSGWVCTTPGTWKELAPVSL